MSAGWVGIPMIVVFSADVPLTVWCLILIQPKSTHIHHPNLNLPYAYSLYCGLCVGSWSWVYLSLPIPLLCVGGVDNSVGDRSVGCGVRLGKVRRSQVGLTRCWGRQKTGSEKVFSGTPGRGVLRFFARAYRRPVHFSAKNAVFSKNLQI